MIPILRTDGLSSVALASRAPHSFLGLVFFFPFVDDVTTLMMDTPPHLREL